MGGILKDTRTAISRVFTRPSYFVLASVIALFAFAVAVWLPNLGLLGGVFGASGISLFTKLKFAVSLFGGISTNFSALSASYTIAIAFLFGMNITMAVYLVRHSKKAVCWDGLSAGALGIVSGTLGVGCAACGSFIASAVLSSLGAVGGFSLLPLRGGEFGILSVVLLAFSLAVVSRRIARSAVS